MSQKPATRKQRKKVREEEKTLPEGPPKRTYKFLSKQYTSLNLYTSSVAVAVERIKVLRKLGLSNTKFLRKVKLARYSGHENFWSIYIRNLVLARGDLRVLEFDQFSWQDFYVKEDLRPIWNVILAKSKRLMTLNANFLAEDIKQLRKVKRFRNLREISIKAEGAKVAYKRLKKALNPRMPIQKLHVNFSRCIEINDPEILAAAVSRLKGLKQINFFFELQENRECQIFNSSVLQSFIEFLGELKTPNLLRVQIAAKEILKICIQSVNGAETAVNFFDVIHKIVNKAGKRALTPALETLSQEHFDVLELEYLHRHISANMIANEIKLIQKVNTLTMYHRKNEHLDIMEKSGEDPLEVYKLGMFVSEEVSLSEDIFKKFINVQELDLYIKYESCRHKALDSLLRFASNNFQVIRLKIVLSWELIMKETEFEDFIAMLADIKKLKSLKLTIFGSYFGKRRFATIGRLEKSTSLEEYTLSLRCYIKNIANEDFMKFFKKAKRLKAFKLLDYTPDRKYDKPVLYGILGRTRNLELINC